MYDDRKRAVALYGYVATMFYQNGTVAAADGVVAHGCPIGAGHVDGLRARRLDDVVADGDVFIERRRRATDAGHIDVDGSARLATMPVTAVHDPVVFDHDVGHRTAFAPAALGTQLDGRAAALLDGVAGDVYAVGLDEVRARQMAPHRVVGDLHGRPAGLVGEEM